MIFVFGSNLRGVHGAGAARHAMEYEGAVWGQGIGHYGNSYALPTKNMQIESLALIMVNSHVTQFIVYASQHHHLQFKVTQIGCGLAGFKPQDIAPMFRDAPDNCYFDRAWEQWLPGKKFWN